MTFCTSCGRENEPQAATCICGHALQRDALNAPPRVDAATVPSRTRGLDRTGSASLGASGSSRLVFRHPKRGHRVTVFQEFSWPATLFGPFWALFHGMIRVAILLTLGNLIVGGAARAFAIFLIVRDGANPMVASIVGLVMISFWLIFVGDRGNQWRVNFLIRRGYEKVAGVSASN